MKELHPFKQLPDVEVVAAASLMGPVIVYGHVEREPIW